MSLESQISALVEAANNLTGTVAEKVQEIDQKVETATSAVPAAVRDMMRSTLYVDAINGDNGNSGTSRSNAKRTINSAIALVPDGTYAAIFLEPGQEHLLDGAIAINDRHVYIHSQSSQCVLRAVPTVEMINGQDTAVSGRFSMGFKGVLRFRHVNLETMTLNDSHLGLNVISYRASMVSTAHAKGLVISEHGDIRINHGSLMHQHSSGNFGSADLRLRESGVKKIDHSSATSAEGRPYLIDLYGGGDIPFEFYAISSSIEGFASWAESVLPNSAMITSNVL